MRTAPISRVVVLRLKLQTKNQNFRTMQFLEKIGKSNKTMALIAVATLAIVVVVLVYKPWKESQGETL